MKPCFIYAHLKSETAWPEESRASEGSPVTLLFTCPMDWMPQNQKQFEEACRFYGVRHPEKLAYSADIVPF